MSAAALIGIDWGTTHCRAYLLDSSGQCLAQQHDTHGASQLRNNEFADVLSQLISAWPNAAHLPVLMAGMVGARNGWHEVPYVQAPASHSDFAKSLFAVPDRSRTWIVPGVRADNQWQRCDVMRGEETQVLGAQLLCPASQRFCLPGTHSKWVQLADERIRQLDTFVTGELFALLRQHSFLSASLRERSDDQQAFVQGLKESAELPLLNAIFSVRVRLVQGQLNDHNASAYLSGLLIGHECRAAMTEAAKSAPLRETCLIASEALLPWYLRAFEHFSIPATSLSGEQAVCAGLWRLAEQSGLLEC